MKIYVIINCEKDLPRLIPKGDHSLLLQAKKRSSFVTDVELVLETESKKVTVFN